MKKNLQAVLGKDFKVEGSDRKMEVTDNKILGYNAERNVAQVEVRNGKIFVNVYRGYFYKPVEFVEAKDLNEVKVLISRRFKVREKHGKDVQDSEAKETN